MTVTKYKVMVADHEDESRHLLTALLKSQPGIVVMAEVDSREAFWQKIAETAPDLVFVDHGWFMQQVAGGWEQIKKRSGLGVERVWLVENCEQAHMAMAGGAFDYIMKPVQTYDLEKTLLKFGVKKNRLLLPDSKKSGVIYLPECNKVCLPTPAGDLFIEPQNVAHLKSKKKHCILTDADYNFFEICLGLKTLVNGFPDKELKKVHKSNAINRRFLHSTNVSGTACKLFINGHMVEVPLSCRGRKKLKEP